ncbi:MAG: TfuA-related McrA-glycine thioamidation protein [Candidatus Methylarchaceae archaeon HK02M1]|nr:TfuA-related McrA-glycine thioamidation protein [Candidatus Methylarchaceae archaeon HK01M]MCP8311369.1 TfuA-related McrA-glycine thioamidation protein [Candidatus Methylarchaceae archaeon HK02M1]
MGEKIIIFTGPSLNPKKAKELFDKATYMPPIKRGDATKAFKNGAKIIGIIDGIFFSEVAVSPRELLYLLDKGVILIGGSSMGALRAAELDVFGMVGVGRIYEMYRNGEINSDDEVALIFSPDTLEPLSEPLINIRYNSKVFVERNLIKAKTAEKILKLSQKLYYPLRTYRRIVNIAVNEKLLTSWEGDEILDLIETHRIDLKNLDAIKVIEKVREIAILQKLI